MLFEVYNLRKLLRNYLGLNPEFIFTSNNFHTDEIFKLWSAIKVERGTKYYIGQHGNNYFIKKIHTLKRKILINSSHGVGIMDQLIINQDLYLIQQVRKNNYDSNGDYY